MGQELNYKPYKRNGENLRIKWSVIFDTVSARFGIFISERSYEYTETTKRYPNHPTFTTSWMSQFQKKLAQPDVSGGKV